MARKQPEEDIKETKAAAQAKTKAAKAAAQAKPKAAKAAAQAKPKAAKAAAQAKPKAAKAELKQLIITSRTLELPYKSDEDYLTLLVRDPYWAFAYWDVSEATLKAMLAKYQKEFKQARLLIKVYKADSSEALALDPQFYMAIDVTHATSNCWYVNLDLPNTFFIAKLGYITLRGAWTEIASSNVIQSPPDEIAGEDDGDWQAPTEIYAKLLNLKFEAAGSQEKKP